MTRHETSTNPKQKRGGPIQVFWSGDGHPLPEIDRAEGVYRIEADGSVCVDFINGFSRCDLYVRSGDRVILLDEKGDRYPLR